MVCRRDVSVNIRAWDPRSRLAGGASPSATHYAVLTYGLLEKEAVLIFHRPPSLSLSLSGGFPEKQKQDRNCIQERFLLRLFLCALRLRPVQEPRKVRLSSGELTLTKQLEFTIVRIHWDAPIVHFIKPIKYSLQGYILIS